MPCPRNSRVDFTIVTALLSLVAGVLTVLAPCVLSFLSVIVGGSLGHGSRRHPYLIAASLVVPLLVFIPLLKASTAFLSVDPRVWAIGSGALVILLGAAMLLPGSWTRVARWTKLEAAHSLPGKARNQRGETAGAFLTGAAPGPAFSSCSPTYAWVIATVLPASPVTGMIYLGIYCAGMAGALLGIPLVGHRPAGRFGWASNPRGRFQRAIAALLIVVGLSVPTGLDKALQTWTVDKFPALTAFKQGLIPQSNAAPGVAGNAEQRQLGPAPELADTSYWVNSNPTTLVDLRGKVVLVDFWTYNCINCMRTQPCLNARYDRYRAAGPETTGVHAPEFTFEKVPEGIEKAVRDADIKYSVALDNDFATWRAYHSRYWPVEYLVDKDGSIRQTHFGEGSYNEVERQIRDLLGETRDEAGVTGETTQPMRGQSSETYLDTRRASGSETRLETGEHDYGQNPAPGVINRWSLSGSWMTGDESITAARSEAQLNYRSAGREMFLVVGGLTGVKVRVQVEGGDPPGGADARGEKVTISGAHLYRLMRLSEATRGTTVTLISDKGVSANVLTFG